MSIAVNQPIVFFPRDVYPYQLDGLVTSVNSNWEVHTYGSTNKQREVDLLVRDVLRWKGKFDIAISERDRKALLAMSQGDTIVPQDIMLYKEGGHFVDHIDRNRPKQGMKHIGTIVLLGGSQHRGGVLKVDVKQVMRCTGKPRACFIPLGAVHSVTPVTSGNRIVITCGVYCRVPVVKKTPHRPHRRPHTIIRRRD